MSSCLCYLYWGYGISMHSKVLRGPLFSSRIISEKFLWRCSLWRQSLNIERPIPHNPTLLVKETGSLIRVKKIYEKFVFVSCTYTDLIYSFNYPFCFPACMLLKMDNLCIFIRSFLLDGWLPFFPHLLSKKIHCWYLCWLVSIQVCNSFVVYSFRKGITLWRIWGTYRAFIVFLSWHLLLLGDVYMALTCFCVCVCLLKLLQF